MVRCACQERGNEARSSANDGVAGAEDHHQNAIKVHPLALLDYERLNDARRQSYEGYTNNLWIAWRRASP